MSRVVCGIFFEPCADPAGSRQPRASAVQNWEGSRPRDPRFVERNNTDQIERSAISNDADLFAAREDPTSPSQTRNKLKTRGYVGQAARPPRLTDRIRYVDAHARLPERSRRWQRY